MKATLGKLVLIAACAMALGLASPALAAQPVYPTQHVSLTHHVHRGDLQLVVIPGVVGKRVELGDGTIRWGTPSTPGFPTTEAVILMSSFGGSVREVVGTSTLRQSLNVAGYVLPKGAGLRVLWSNAEVSPVNVYGVLNYRYIK